MLIARLDIELQKLEWVVCNKIFFGYFDQHGEMVELVLIDVFFKSGLPLCVLQSLHVAL